MPGRPRASGLAIVARAGSVRVLASLAAILVAASLGAFAAAGLRNAETLVSQLYEEALASTSTASEASSAFARMRATDARRREPVTPQQRDGLDAQVAELRRSLSMHLETVASRALSIRARQAALLAQDAADDWSDGATALSTGVGTEGLRADLDRYVALAEVQFALLAATTADAAAALRADVARSLERERRLVIAATAVAMLLAVTLAWFGGRRGGAASVAAPPSDAPEQAPTDHGSLASRGESCERDPDLCCDLGTREADLARLAATNRNLQAALDDMSQGLCLYDADHRLLVANRRYSEIYRLEPGAIRKGLQAADVIERSMAAGNHGGESVVDLLAQCGRPFDRAEDAPYIQELGDGRAIEIVGRVTADGGFVATYEDVTERWHAESRIAHMARHDALTSLPNRVLLGERIAGAVTQAGRKSGFAVHCLDLDNFKQVNDTLGHPVGDELLRAVAHRLAACLREVDTVARLGGDEFAIVQAGIERPEDAEILARRIVEVVSAPYELTDYTVTVGVSIGIALAPRDGLASDRLLKNADVALYRAKDDGRGVFRFFEAEMDARLQARRLLEMDLRAAVAAEAFELHYQPIYDLRENRICGFEALLRWTHASRGRVSPVDFIPLAEEIGLIVPLGEWVLRQACAEAARWSDDLKIAVNISPAQFQSAQLIDVVRATLAETGLPACRLELEITESVLLTNGGATVAILHAMRALGARISMDDFGTGYSSLSYLRSFPFDKMKIDKSFIRDLTIENGSGFIVRTVISLGSSLGMTMTAEGVETEDQLARLRAEGCDEVQGFLFSPPVPAAQVPALVVRWNGIERVAA